MLINFAKQAGLDMAKYKECVDSKRHAKEIDADNQLASSLSITGSPSFLVGRAVGDKFVGLVLGGAHPFDAFDDLITRTLRHRAYASSQADDRTILYASAVLKKDSHNTIALLDRAKARRNKYMAKEALKDVERALRLNRSFPRAYLERGIILSMKGKEEAAIADFTHAISLSPDLSEPYFRRGISQENKGRFAQAALDFERAKALAKDDARPSFFLGMHYLRDGKYAAAVAEFDVAAKINFSWSMIPRYRAVAHKALNELDKAAYDLQNSAYLDKSAPEYLESARLFKSLGKWREAILPLRMIADLQPSAVNFLELGMAEARARYMEAAIVSFSKALEVDARSAGAFLQRCLARAAKGEMATALADCDKAVELDPKASTALASRGVVRFAAGRTQDALSDFDAAVEAHPDYAEALFGRGLAKERLGDINGAAEDRRKAEGMLPTVEQRYRSLVMTTNDQGELSPTTE
jgi:tetratricopeptide (TPR) repeat protein